MCTHNSARSQMAEGLLRHLAGERFEAMSAGTEATSVRPLAIRAMGEIGVDISGQEPETLERYLGQPFDYVITVCDDANEACPFFPGASRRLHWPMEDPSRARGFGEREARRLQEGTRRASGAHKRRAYEPGIAPYFVELRLGEIRKSRLPCQSRLTR